MGLGKTIQAIAAAEILARSAGVERVLIVSPTSLKHQWQRGDRAVHRPRRRWWSKGCCRAAAELYRGRRRSSRSPTTTSSTATWTPSASWQPDLIILDEAQRIKNWKTRTAQSVKRLDSQYAIVLTGTPLENRLEELHSIVEFVDRFRLGPMFRFLAEHQHVDETRPRGRLPQPVGRSRRRSRRSSSAAPRTRCSRNCPSGWKSASSCR